jgi:hypothetical protein
MSTTFRTSETHGRRRHTPAILAVLAAVVCGAATLEVAITRPVHPAVDAAPGVVSIRPSATPPVSATAPSAPSSVGTGFVTTAAHTPAPPPIPSPAGTTPGFTSLEPDLVLLGSWTVAYAVGPANGNGANIVIPLGRLDRRVVKPGATFDFWTAIGEVSRRTGYRRGAIISGHRVDVDGALAGGICTVSTALFNAAARAGLQITARTSHSGYLAKYPLGLDAAVAKGDDYRQTMAFRNDSSEPIVIRTVSTPGIARVDLYAQAPLGRTVVFSQPAIGHRQKAHDRHVGTNSLARGEHRRVADRSDGMTVSVSRIVRDVEGRVLHRDRWVSVYRWLGGLVLDGIG